jgi:penicillin-binding protein-related factor A (putative recombinase)
MKKGGGFEEIIRRLLCSAGLGDITPIEPPVRVLKNIGAGKFVIIFESNGILDFAGPVCGMHAEFDCKDFKGHRFPFSKVKHHQLERIRRLTDNGALVGIVLRLRGITANDDKLYGVPGWALLNAIEAGDKSLSIDDLDAMVEAGDVTRLAYFKANTLVEFLELCSQFKYILPANYLKGHKQPWTHRRKDLKGLSIGSSMGSSASSK